MQKIELPIEKEETDKISPLKPDFKWFFKMIFTIFLSIIVIYIWVLWFSRYIIANISIEKEKEIFWEFFLNIFLEWEKQVFDKKILWENLWELENFTIYVSNEEIPNAFAIPWAHIIITKWLLKEAKTKEEVLFILAHEMYHIKNRDVIKNMSETLPFTMILWFLGIDFWTWVLNSNNLISSYLSREAERKADFWASEFMNKLWLNSSCATRFFKEIWWNDSKTLEFIQTHPINPERIDFIEKNTNFKDKKCEDFKWEEKK